MPCLHFQFGDNISRPIMPFIEMDRVVRAADGAGVYNYSIMLGEPCACHHVQPKYFVTSRDSLFTKFDLNNLIFGNHPKKGFVYKVRVSSVTFDHVTLEGINFKFTSTVHESQLSLKGFDQKIDCIGEHVDVDDQYIFCFEDDDTFHLKFVSRKKVKTWYEKLVSFVSSCFLEPAAQ